MVYMYIVTWVDSENNLCVAKYDAKRIAWALSQPGRYRLNVYQPTPDRMKELFCCYDSKTGMLLLLDRYDNVVDSYVPRKKED